MCSNLVFYLQPEGSPLVVNRALLVDLKNEQHFTETVNITTPRNIVDGSLEISVSVIGKKISTNIKEHF